MLLSPLSHEVARTDARLEDGTLVRLFSISPAALDKIMRAHTLLRSSNSLSTLVGLCVDAPDRITRAVYLNSEFGSIADDMKVIAKVSGVRRVCFFG